MKSVVIEGQDFRSVSAAAKYLVKTKHMTIMDASEELTRLIGSKVSYQHVYLAASPKGQNTLKKAGARQHAKRMLRTKADVAEIIKRTGLSKDEISNIAHGVPCKKTKSPKKAKVVVKKVIAKKAKKNVKKATKKPARKENVPEETLDATTTAIDPETPAETESPAESTESNAESTESNGELDRI